MFYARSTLNRADHLRKDELTLKSLRSSANAQLVPVWRGKSLVSKRNTTASPQAMMLAPHSILPSEHCVFLGQEQECSYFAIDVTALDDRACDALAEQAIGRDGIARPSEFADLRIIGPILSDQDGALLAYARGLIYWNNYTRYCIRCANALEPSNGGHVRQCSNEACGYQAFPRTDPAVIMIVSHVPADGSEPLCLLGRSHAWPEGVYSTLAGFVEPGESLEQAVQREVREEASIETCDVRYVASQPWPFPRSIMLGFEASATSTDIVCDPEELEDAQWFTREQVQTFGDWGDDSPGYKLPRSDSISRFLIDRWIGGS